MLLVGIAMIIYAILRYTVLTVRAKKKIARHIRFTIAGLIIITICGTIDIVRFWAKDNQDPAKYVRVGFLLFLICFLVANSEQIIDAFKTSMKAALISKLAYEDGLTGLKNRTSYNEALEKIKNEKISTGIVMMDVNNLKQVNDNEGHDAGDSMLIYASEIIRDAFDKRGVTCYRIGGDEFVALVQTEQIKEDCEGGLQKLAVKYKEFNETTDFCFKIKIAAGYDIYEAAGDETALDETVKKADSEMYANKKYLKEIRMA